MRNVLCAFREPATSLTEEICKFGYENGWLIEFVDRILPRGWVGDGVLTDFYSIDELKKLSQFEEIPIVSRELLPRSNIRTVSGGGKMVAELVFEHFSSKGFTTLAGVDARDWYSERSDEVVNNDPIRFFREIARENGADISICYWEPNLKYSLPSQYSRALKKLHEFFMKMSRPFGLFIPSGRYLTLCYRALSAIGLKVPEDVAIICNTSNIALLESMPVSVTGISSELRVCGRKMAELLQRMMNNEPVPEGQFEIAEPGTIIPRQSTDMLAVSDQRLAKAITFILKNYGENICMDDIATAANITSATLSRLFKKYLQTAPLRFLQTTRMNKICSLLEETGLTLNEIASRTGYGSDMALSLAFKQHFKMSPGAYRARHK